MLFMREGARWGAPSFSDSDFHSVSYFLHGMSEIVTSLPKQFMDEYWDHLIGAIPEEKAQVELRQQRTARVMAAVGSEKIEGVGQKIAEIDARLYFRMLHSFGHEENWLNDMLRDNPQLCAPGYKPKAKKGGDLRHGKTFIGGAPV